MKRTMSQYNFPSTWRGDKRKYGRMVNAMLEFTDYRSTAEIRTQKDLDSFFSQLRENGPKQWKGSKAQKDAVASQLTYFKRKNVVRVRTTKFKESRRKFINAYESGKVITYNKKRVYRVRVLKGFRYRDELGRFAKGPKN